MILKTVITTLDALAIIIFVAFGLNSLKAKNDTAKVSFTLTLLIAINTFMMWC